jgi:hypothetical protein
MNVLEKPGNIIYRVITAITFIGGLVVSFGTLFGLAWGGTQSIGFDLAAIFGNLSTFGLLVGLVGVSSRRKSIAFITLLSAAFVPVVIACLYAPIFWTPNIKISAVASPPRLWLLFLAINITEIYLTSSKLYQLRTPEVTPCPQ